MTVKLDEPINNELTRLLGIQTPIVGAAMAGAAGGSLAAQITLGGGFGFLAAGYDSPAKFGAEISIARASLGIEPGSRIPIGVGFLGWQLDKPTYPTKDLLSIAFDSNVQAVWFAFGNNMGHWISFIRENDPRAGTEQAITVFVQVSSTEEALRAMKEWHVDVIVAQGIEAGGHGASYAPPLLTLVPEILALRPPGGPPVLGAGGLANGAHIASLLTLGASGVVLGTRFLLSPESSYTDKQRQALVAANSEASVRSMAFDYARNTLEWPRGIDGRGLRNATVNEYENGEDIGILRSKFTEAMRTNDTDRIIVWAGSSIGLMNKIQPAKDIVNELHQECVQALKASAKLLLPPY